MVDRKAFEEYITNSFEKKKGSKVISREKGKEIAAYLSVADKDHKVTVKADPHFKFWVKSRGFRLLDYPALGMKNVLYACSYYSLNQRLIHACTSIFISCISA